MEAKEDTLHLLTQSQRELQLFLKTNNNQNHQKIELYGNPTTKGLNHFQPDGRRDSVADGWKVTEMQCGVERKPQWRNGWSHIQVWWTKIRRDTLGESKASLRSERTA